MKLSKTLQQYSDSGDFGGGLEGLSAIAKRLEDSLLLPRQNFALVQHQYLRMQAK